MITAFLIANLLFFPSPIYRDPSGAQEIALTQWGEAYIGVAHNDMAGAALYQADEVRVLIGGEWVEYQVAESGIFLCETPRPNCNDETFRRMYEPGAVILATCWPRSGVTQGQWIIKLLPLDTMYKIKYTPIHDKN